MNQNQLTLDQRGPKVVEKSVRIYKNSTTLRISSDLLSNLSKTEPDVWAFECHVDIAKQLLYLRLIMKDDPVPIASVKGWRNAGAKCLLVPIREAITRLELNKNEVPGEYKAEIKRGSIIVHLDKKI